jgi:hypothetical protein
VVHVTIPNSVPALALSSDNSPVQERALPQYIPALPICEWKSRGNLMAARHSLHPDTGNVPGNVHDGRDRPGNLPSKGSAWVSAFQDVGLSRRS